MKEKHIIDWILDKTQIDDEKIVEKKSAYDIRKIKIDDTIYYCEECKHCWSKVPVYVERMRFKIYPKGNIPTIGKKRKRCMICQ